MDEAGTAAQITILGVTLGRPVAALATVAAAYLLKLLLDFIYCHVLVPLTARSKSELDDRLLDCARRPCEALIVVGGLFIAVIILQLPATPYDLHGAAVSLLKAMVIATGGWFLFNLTSLIDRYLSDWAIRSESAMADQLAPLLRKTLRFLVIILTALMVVQSFGYPITGLLASLGIGGLAFALAAKDTLSNVFGSLMIIFDRPFKVGDWVQAGEMEGTVEEVGFRSTKIRTFSKTLVSVPNNVIANMAVDNFSRMQKRRVKMTVGITYATTPGQMREVVSRIRAMLADHPAVDQEVSLVNFTDFGASSLDITVYCFTRTTAWQEYLDAREDICLKIMEIVEGLGLEFAYPTRTVYLYRAGHAGAPLLTPSPRED